MSEDIERMIVQIFLDSGCLNIWGREPILNKLENLKEQGKVEFFTSGTIWREQTRLAVKEPFRERYLKRLQDIKFIPETTIFNFFIGEKGARFSNKESMQKIEQIAKICFPNKSWSELTESEQNDVRALEAHAYEGLDYFLTLNKNDFIIKGKKKKLKEMGIRVREPDDAFVKELEKKLKIQTIKKG